MDAARSQLFCQDIAQQFVRSDLPVPVARWRRGYRHVSGLELVLLAVAFMSFPETLCAQDFDLQRPSPHTSLWSGVRFVNWTVDETTDPAVVLDFTAPVYELGFSFIAWRVNGHLYLGYGRQSASSMETNDLDLFNGEVLAWLNVLLVDDREQLALTFPILLSYRRIGVTDSPVEKDALGILVLGVGVGFSLNTRLGQGITLESRAAPLIAMTAAKAQQDRLIPETRGLFDADLVFHFERVLGTRQGLSFGFTFRYQRVAVGRDFFPNAPPDQEWFSFKSSEFAIRLGFHW